MKSNYKWPCPIATLNYQRVSIEWRWVKIWDTQFRICHWTFFHRWWILLPPCLTLIMTSHYANQRDERQVKSVESIIQKKIGRLRWSKITLEKPWKMIIIKYDQHWKKNWKNMKARWLSDPCHEAGSSPCRDWASRQCLSLLASRKLLGFDPLIVHIYIYI